MGRPSTKTTETIKKEEVKVEKTKVTEPKVESKDLKKEPINTQAEEIAKLQAQIDLLMKAQVAVPQSSNKPKKKMIKIVSLANGGLTLQGSRIIRIANQFESVMVTESEARIIVSNMPESARNGLFYITDKDFVEENELEDAYATILSDEQLRTLLNKKVEEVVNIYNNISDKQKEIVNSMIIDGRLNGKKIDANLLQELSTISGIDFVGIEKIEEV